MNIALYLWLPLYLNDSLGYTSFVSGLLSTLFDIGGVAGGPIIGFLSDQDGRTLSWICKASLISASAFIVMAVFSGQGILILGPQSGSLKLQTFGQKWPPTVDPTVSGEA